MSKAVMQNVKNPQFSDSHIFILGPLDLQNELLAYVLEKEIGTPCFVVENINTLFNNNKIDPARRLLLIDCNGRGLKGTPEWTYAKRNGDSRSHKRGRHERGYR